MLNKEVFENIKNAQKKIVVVTKYWDNIQTQKIFDSCLSNYPDIFFGLGENRTQSLQDKNLERDYTHFIGNIQSRKIGEIVEHCSTIHSLDSLKHAEKIENQAHKTLAFLQIKLDPNKDTGVSEDELSHFLISCKDYQNLTIIGISGMGAGDVSESQKREEFKKLIHIRDTYISNGLISAGTSRDYEIALEEGVDIVRVGSGAIL